MDPFVKIRPGTVKHTVIRQFSVDPKLILACRCCGTVCIFQFLSRFKKTKGIERVSRLVSDPVLLRSLFRGNAAYINL